MSGVASGLGTLPPRAVRQLIREGLLDLPTAGCADGFMQANLVILPAGHAEDFARFCALNPKPCPLIAQGRPGDPALPGLGDIDIRRDVARYRIHRVGQAPETVDDLSGVWRNDLVSFALGCSFSFEGALTREGIPVRHIDARRNVPMYVTNIANAPAGPFAGAMVVSLRALPPAQAIRAIILSERFPLAHGAPVHIGDPAAIGIGDVMRPDFGDPPVIAKDDILVFWACGVTPQMALKGAGLDLAITHEPGYMLVTDLPASHGSAPEMGRSA